MSEGAVRTITIAGRELGRGRDCLVIAEVGINHNGDLDLARECIAAAARAGADVVKFQNYRTEDFISDRSITISYSSRGEPVTEPQYDLFKRCELSRADLGVLKRECERQGVLFASTPTSEEGVRELTELGVPLMKNGSDYLGHLPLIRRMGETGLPTLISTGMATREDIDDAVRAFRSTGNAGLVLLHCTSLYPTPPEQVNLARMAALAAEFRCPVGFSDHSQGTAAAIGAVALGACVIEKHFTTDRDLPGPDHRYSMDPAELTDLVRQVRLVGRGLGSASIAPARDEAANREQYRLSCVAARSLHAGHALRDEDIAFRRPGTGLPPSQVASLLGRKLRGDVTAGQVLRMEDLA